MIPKKYQLFVVVFTILCLIVIIIGLYSLVSRHDNKQMISALNSVGIENTSHVDFINKVICRFRLLFAA